MNAHVILGALSNIVSILIGLMLGLALADISSGESILSNWQGLAAGVLAVLAAFVTIAQMRVSDIRQDRRHFGLMSLSVRSDHLKIRRAARPYADYLTLFSTDIHKEIEQTDTGISARNFALLEKAAKSIVLTLEKPEITAISEFLGGEETLRLELLRRTAKAFSETNAQRVQIVQMSPAPSVIARHVESVVGAAMILGAQAQGFANDLQVLDETYSQGRIFDHGLTPSPDR
jgi:hypothetical protein